MLKPPSNAKILKELNTQLKNLQTDRTIANKAEGKDDNIIVKVQKDQARFKRIKKDNEPDKATGHFLIQIDITAKSDVVFIPLSIASGKKPTGFIYQIEGTAEGTISTADVTVRGEGVTQITVGTLLFAKIPQGSTASFRILTTIRGKIGKTYKITITRINYKLNQTDPRYQQYIKEIVSDSVKFS